MTPDSLLRIIFSQSAETGHKVLKSHTTSVPNTARKKTNSTDAHYILLQVTVSHNARQHYTSQKQGVKTKPPIDSHLTSPLPQNYLPQPQGCGCWGVDRQVKRLEVRLTSRQI